MADTTNLSKFLEDMANSIRTKKGTTEPIPAGSFDTEIESIATGTVVEKVVAEASEIIEDENAVVIDTTPIPEPVVIPENGVAEVLADKALLAENIGLTPEKILEGNTILNIEGTGKGGEEINNQDKEITENGVYTADEGYTGLGTILVKVKDAEEVDTNARNTLMYILGINQIAFNALKNTLKIEQDYIDAGGTPDEICYVLNEIIEGGNQI